MNTGSVGGAGGGGNNFNIPPIKKTTKTDGTEGSEAVQPTQPITPNSNVSRDEGSGIANADAGSQSNLGNQQRDGSQEQALPKQKPGDKDQQTKAKGIGPAAFLDLTPEGKEYQDALDAAGGNPNHPDVIAKLKEIRARSSSGAYQLKDLRPPQDT